MAVAVEATSRPPRSDTAADEAWRRYEQRAANVTNASVQRKRAVREQAGGKSCPGTGKGERIMGKVVMEKEREETKIKGES